MWLNKFAFNPKLLPSQWTKHAFITTNGKVLCWDATNLQSRAAKTIKQTSKQRFTIKLVGMLAFSVRWSFDCWTSNKRDFSCLCCRINSIKANPKCTCPRHITNYKRFEEKYCAILKYFRRQQTTCITPQAINEQKNKKKQGRLLKKYITNNLSNY